MGKAGKRSVPCLFSVPVEYLVSNSRIFFSSEGWFTNYLALKVIFSPLEPTKYCGITFHGIFLRRQKEVSEIYARVICTEILHVKAIFDDIFAGPLSANFYAMLRAHTLVFTDKMTAELKPLAIAAMGSEKFAAMKEAIAQKVLDEIPSGESRKRIVLSLFWVPLDSIIVSNTRILAFSVIDQSYEYTTAALGLEAEMRTKMEALSTAEFEGVLHPAFQEDEIQLIVVGGVLGAIVGVFQIFLVF